MVEYGPRDDPVYSRDRFEIDQAGTRDRLWGAKIVQQRFLPLGANTGHHI